MAKIIVYTYNFAWMDGVTILWSNYPTPILREGINTSYKIEWVQRGLSDGPWFIKTDKGTSAWKYETKE